MEQKPTLFNYLHDSLVQQIMSGKLVYGEKLPSLRTLCDLYHVGIRTVRDVMDALVKEGYVETVQRSYVKVIYRTDEDSVRQARAVLARQDMSLDIMMVLSYILPPIYAQACRFCNEEIIRACRADIRGIEELSTKDQWRKSRVPFQRIKSVYHNELLQDLCEDLDLSAQIRILPGFENPYQEMGGDSEQGLNHFYDCIAAQDYKSVYAIIRKMYRIAADITDGYYSRLNSLYPMEKPRQETFQWNAQKGRLRIHMQVTRSIIKKICKGIYPDGTYLPSGTELCREYKISAYTLGNVTETLVKMGLVKKMNQRGGYLITCENACKNESFISGSTFIQDALTFLEAVHLIALISEGVADLSFVYINEEILEAICQKVKYKQIRELSASILATLIQIQPYEPLREIYRQLENLVDWGCYISFVIHEESVFDIIQNKSKTVIACIRKQDQAAFAQALKDTYRYVFEAMRDTLIDLGVQEADRLRL